MSEEIATVLSRRWHFRLAGDAFDINAVAGAFSEEAKFIKDDHDQTFMVLELPFGRDESGAAQGAAEELLAKLNGVAQILYGNHENITISGVGLKDTADGPLHLFIHVCSAIRGRSRVFGNLTVANSSAPVAAPPRNIGDRWLAAADKNEHLERALYLFGSLPLDWRGLYMVLEAAEDAHGGARKLIAKSFVPDGQIKRFKETANSYKALRLAARHGSIKQGVDQPKMTYLEAREMVRTVLEKWANEVA